MFSSFGMYWTKQYDRYNHSYKIMGVQCKKTVATTDTKAPAVRGEEKIAT